MIGQRTFIRSILVFALALTFISSLSAQKTVPDLSGEWVLDKDRSDRGDILNVLIEDHISQYKGTGHKVTYVTTLTIVQNREKLIMAGRTAFEVCDGGGKLVRRYPMYDSQDEILLSGAVEIKSFDDGRKSERRAEWIGNQLRITRKISSSYRGMVGNGAAFIFALDLDEQTYQLSPSGNELTVVTSVRKLNPGKVSTARRAKRIYRKLA